MGYGIDDEKYSDYKNVNVEGKIVVVLEGIPEGKNVDNSWANWGKKIEFATKHKGIAMVTIQKEFEK